MALPDILSELETCGYRTRTFLIPACAIGARHRRYRVAIVGYSEHNGLSATAISGSSQTASSRQQKRQKTSCELEGASKSRNSEDVANTKSKCEGRLFVRETQENPGFVGSREDVQYSDGAGREEQYTSQESDKKGFPGWGCDEGYVCHPTSKRLQNRTSQSMVRQRTQEQKPQRSVRRTAESVLGGVADGVSDWLDEDLDFLINHYWDKEPDIPRIATGIEHRIDRLKCLGNAVVPQQFYPIFKAIADVERMNYGEKK